MTGRDAYRGRAALLQLGRDALAALEHAADGIATVGQGIALLATAWVPTPARDDPFATEIGARSLDVDHLGRWVLIPGRPNSTREQRDRAGLAVAGRLVGLEPGEYPLTGSDGISRRLILLQGGTTRAVLVPVDAVVRVGAREWS